MKFEWDEGKRVENLKKHRLDFADVSLVFENVTVTEKDDRFDYREQRYHTLGILRGIIVAVSHTESDDLVRVISLRKAEKYEEQIYFSQIPD